jgi:hypothetical protein
MYLCTSPVSVSALVKLFYAFPLVVELVAALQELRMQPLVGELSDFPQEGASFHLFLLNSFDSVDSELTPQDSWT